jgi:SHS2 domain-containing protein
MTSAEPRRSVHRFEEHTGEVQLAIEAASLASLFEEAGRALAALMLDDPSLGAPGAPKLVVVAARDREALLVAWLNELIFHADTEHRVATDFAIEEVSDVRLRAVVRAVEPPHLRTAVKAATFHRLRITEDDRGYAATIVLDV